MHILKNFVKLVAAVNPGRRIGEHVQAVVSTVQACSKLLVRNSCVRVVHAADKCLYFCCRGAVTMQVCMPCHADAVTTVVFTCGMHCKGSKQLLNFVCHRRTLEVASQHGPPTLSPSIAHKFGYGR